jgi:glycopeptide antibiotics resistance protein
MNKHLLLSVIFITYCVILIKILVFKELPLILMGSMKFRFGGVHGGAPNFLPFSTILPYLLGRNGAVIGGINILGNILLLVPVGFLFPFVYRKMTWNKCLVAAISAGLIIELMQAGLRIGIFDVDDVILNGLGVIIGYWIFAMVTKGSRRKKLKALPNEAFERPMNPGSSK